MKENLVQTKSYQFAVEVVKLSRYLSGKKLYSLSDQLLRSGTSIGANIEESLAGRSRRDFLAKIAISSSEAREARYWLRLLKDTKLLPEEYNSLLEKSEELIRILTAIVKSTSKSLQK